MSPAGDAITIDAAHHPTDTKYYIGVWGFREATYSLLARMDQPVRLSDGQPQHDAVESGESHYYELHVDETRGEPDIMFDLVPQSGTVEVYITSNTAGEPVHQPNRDTGFYYWHAQASWYSPMHLVLRATEQHFLHTRGQYNVQVYGDVASNFTLTAASRSAVITLRDGHSTTEDCAPGEYEYFQFFVSNSTYDVDIDVTPFTGKVWVPSDWPTFP